MKYSKTFTYVNHIFRPLGKLSAGSDFFEVTRRCRSIGISSYNGGEYSHLVFYEEATKFGGREVDIFLMDGAMVVVLCGNGLGDCDGFFESN